MKKIFLAIALSLSTVVYAACPQLYPNNTTINVPQTVELCNKFFVSRFNINNNATVVVSEKLTKGTPVGSMSRVTSFHTDSRAPRVKSSMYTNTGYDRGHMAASDDASTSSEMYETYAMTNMTPQEPTLNQQAWKRLEELVRKQFLSDTVDYHILNVALYIKPVQYVNNIPVPTSYWKIVYRGTKTDYYFALNKPNAIVKKTTAVDVNNLINNAQNF